GEPLQHLARVLTVPAAVVDVEGGEHRLADRELAVADDGARGGRTDGEQARPARRDDPGEVPYSVGAKVRDRAVLLAGVGCDRASVTCTRDGVGAQRGDLEE